MTTLALTEQDNKVLTDIKFYTENLVSKIEALGEVNSSNTIQAKALKDEATGLEKMVENMRLQIVGPYNDFVKKVNAKAKEYSNPIEEIKADIVGKIKTYELAVKAEEDRKSRIVSDTIKRFSVACTMKDIELIYEQCEVKDPTVEFVYARRKNEVEESIRLAEIKKEQEAEALRLAEIRKSQDAETIRLAEEAQRIKDEARELEESKNQMQAQSIENQAIRNIENEIVITNPKTKGTRTMWKMEILDASLVPREFCDPNEVKIREAMKNGTREIAGVRIYEDIIVS